MKAPTFDDVSNRYDDSSSRQIEEQVNVSGQFEFL